MSLGAQTEDRLVEREQGSDRGHDNIKELSTLDREARHSSDEIDELIDELRRFGDLVTPALQAGGAVAHGPLLNDSQLRGGAGNDKEPAAERRTTPRMS